MNESENDSINSSNACFESDEDTITLHVTNLLALENDPTLVSKTMGLLRVLLSSNSSSNNKDTSNNNRKTAFRRGAHVAVVYAMRRNNNNNGANNNNNWQIQNDGCGILVSLCRYKLDNFKRDVIAVGGLAACLEAMDEHDTDHHVQAIGCCLIANLWCSSSRSSTSSLDVPKKVMNQGGLAAVIRAMENHEENAQVQYRACRALFVLLRNESSPPTTIPGCCWARAVVDVGSIGLVIAAMNNHADNAKIQIIACDFLSSLAKKKKKKQGNNNDGDEEEDEDYYYRNLIVDAKGLGPIVEARRIHKDNAQVKLAARNALKVIR